jgi:hypothetical protein
MSLVWSPLVRTLCEAATQETRSYGETGGIVVSDFRIEQAFDRSDDEMDRQSCGLKDDSSASSSPARNDRPNESDCQEASSEITQHLQWSYKAIVLRAAEGKVARSYDHLPNRGRQKVLDRMKDTLRAVTSAK